MFTADSPKERSFALALVAAGVLARLLPHPANVAPVAALALFSGVTLPPALAFTVPLATLVLSDLVIGPHALVAFTAGGFAAIAAIGLFLRSRPRAADLFAGTLAGSAIFFIVSNFGVFLFGGLYPRTPEGLVRCYVLALPFFRNTLLGDLFFSAALFGTFAAVKSRFLAKPLLSRAS